MLKVSAGIELIKQIDLLNAVKLINDLEKFEIDKSLGKSITHEEQENALKNAQHRKSLGSNKILIE